MKTTVKLTTLSLALLADHVSRGTISVKREELVNHFYDYYLKT
jgi:hypothetical protein